MVFNGKTITYAVKQLQTDVFTVKQFVEVVGFEPTSRREVNKQIYHMLSTNVQFFVLKT